MLLFLSFTHSYPTSIFLPFTAFKKNIIPTKLSLNRILNNRWNFEILVKSLFQKAEKVHLSVLILTKCKWSFACRFIFTVIYNSVFITAYMQSSWIVLNKNKLEKCNYGRLSNSMKARDEIMITNNYWMPQTQMWTAIIM